MNTILCPEDVLVSAVKRPYVLKQRSSPAHQPAEGIHQWKGFVSTQHALWWPSPLLAGHEAGI